MSFKKYWSKYRGHPGLRGKPRRWRRAMEWYHTDKRVRVVNEGIVNIAGVNT